MSGHGGTDQINQGSLGISYKTALSTPFGDPEFLARQPGRDIADGPVDAGIHVPHKQLPQPESVTPARLGLEALHIRVEVNGRSLKPRCRN